MGTKVAPAPEFTRKRNWWTILVAMFLAVVATLLVVQTFPRLFFRQAPAADDPILMAGGSLTIRGGAGGQFNVSGHDAVYTPANGTIQRVDIFYRDAAGAPAFTTLPFNSGSDSVQLNYCGDPANCAPVSARSNPSGHGFVFGPVDGDTISPGTNLFSHAPATGYIQSVAFAGATYQCRDAAGVDGKCSIVVRYCRWCK